MWSSLHILHLPQVLRLGKGPISWLLLSWNGFRVRAWGFRMGMEDFVRERGGYTHDLVIIHTYGVSQN